MPSGRWACEVPGPGTPTSRPRSIVGTSCAPTSCGRPGTSSPPRISAGSAAVTAPRVQQLNGTMYRQLGLDQARLDRAATTIVEALSGGQYLTRAELGRLLGASGTELAYLVMNAEVEGLIASGPMRGAQHTYAVLTERVATPATGDASELAYRFYVGHGPAGVRDLARWSSLTQSQAADATEAAAPRLTPMVVAGETLWTGPAADDPGEPAYGALLAAAVRRADPDLSATELPVGRPAPASARRRPLRRLGDHQPNQRRHLAADRSTPVGADRDRSGAGARPAGPRSGRGRCGRAGPVPGAAAGAQHRGRRGLG